MQNLRTYLVIVLVGAFGLSACGGDKNASDAGSGQVSLYLTDDLGNYEHVITSLNTVQLVHTGTDTRCDLLTTPQSFDITELGVDKLLDLVNIRTCPARSYNRVYLEFPEDVELTDANQVTTACQFRSYKDQSNRPNILFCNNGICRININGAVNVLANHHQELALDFDLKEFEVSMNGAACEVTLRVSPIHADDKMAESYIKSLRGLVSNLDTVKKTFTLTRDATSYTVDYGAVTQADPSTLLKRAMADSLRVAVRCTSFDPVAKLCSASGAEALHVKLEGKLSALDMAMKTFTLTYTGGKTMVVDYSAARVDGSLINDVNVEVELHGFDTNRFLAREVEVD